MAHTHNLQPTSWRGFPDITDETERVSPEIPEDVLDSLSLQEVIYNGEYALLLGFDKILDGCIEAMQRRFVKIEAERSDAVDNDVTYMELQYRYETSLMDGSTSIDDITSGYDSVISRQDEIKHRYDDDAERVIVNPSGGSGAHVIMNPSDKHGDLFDRYVIAAAPFIDSECDACHKRNAMDFPTLQELSNRRREIVDRRNENALRVARRQLKLVDHDPVAYGQRYLPAVYNLQVLPALSRLIHSQRVRVLYGIDIPSPVTAETERKLYMEKFPDSPHMAYMARSALFSLGRYSERVENARNEVFNAAEEPYGPDFDDIEFESLVIQTVMAETLELCTAVSDGLYQKAQQMFKRHVGPFARQLGFDVE